MLLIAAIAHASWNLAAKRVGNGGALIVWVCQTVSAAVVAPIAVAVAIGTECYPRWSWLLVAVPGSILHGVYFVVLQRGYAAGDMSVVYPVARGSGPLLTVCAAVVLLGERPGAPALLGVAAVACGVVVIAFSTAAERRSTRVSVGYGFATGVTVAAFTLWDAYVMSTRPLPALLYFSTRTLTFSLLLLPYVIPRRTQLWCAHRRQLCTVGAVAPITSVLVLYAMSLAPLSVVAPIRELSIVIGGVLAWRTLGEANPIRRLTGTCIVLAGIVTIALAG
ncbi:EamA family transporter [Nocardia sp. NPDC051321]|uniref:EamA family transporter n=1 Tax=Nocardia sp. NPDC051321 TaxID=3364323 RepID=UPI0037994FD5